MSHHEALVKPDVLHWARKSAAYDIEAAAKRLQVKPQRIKEWESGDRKPTLRQLRNIANVYRRPFAALFRSSPPPVTEPIADFRLGTAGDDQELSPALTREIRRARFRQKTAIELVEETEEAMPSFALSIAIQQSSESAGLILRKFIDVDLRTQKNWPVGRETFNNWRASFERASILVFQSADVKLDEMRGFSLSSPVLPAIIVNRKDAYSGKVFTLFHELVHLALDRAGMCDLRGGSEEEVFCNSVAAEALVPSSYFKRNPLLPNDESVKSSAQEYGVSEEVIWRRLLDHGSITGSHYQAKRSELLERFERVKEDERKRRAARGGGGPSPARDTVSLSGRYYTGLVLSALGNGSITSADAAEYMGVRAKHFDRISQEIVTTR